MSLLSWLFGNKKTIPANTKPGQVSNSHAPTQNDQGAGWLDAREKRTIAHLRYIAQKMHKFLPPDWTIEQSPSHPDAYMNVSFDENNTVSSGDIFGAKVDGKNTTEYAAPSKHDLDVMLRCCRAEMECMARTGMVAAPSYFERVAILAKKAGRFDLEIAICKMYIKALIIYKVSHMESGRRPPLHMDHVKAKFQKRLPAARTKRKSQVADKSDIDWLKWLNGGEDLQRE